MFLWRAVMWCCMRNAEFFQMRDIFNIYNLEDLQTNEILTFIIHCRRPTPIKRTLTILFIFSWYPMVLFHQAQETTTHALEPVRDPPQKTIDTYTSCWNLAWWMSWPACASHFGVSQKINILSSAYVVAITYMPRSERSEALGHVWGQKSDCNCPK